MIDLLNNIRRLLLLNLAVAGTYIALSMQAKILFASELIAITLWLPAGLANGVVLLYGPVVAPAVVAANLVAASCHPNGSCISSPGFLLIAFAAGGQALLVRSALLRHGLVTDSLSQIPRLLLFLFWIGPAGCWPAAVTYAFCAYASGDFRESSLITAMFWWMGDSLGSLLFLPLLLLFLPFGNPLWHDRRGVLLRPLLALVSLLALLSFLGRELASSMTRVPGLVEPLQLLRLLLSVTLLLVALGGLGLLLHTAGMLLDSQRQLRRGRLAADAAGALLHEIGQPLLRLQLCLDRLRDALSRQAATEPLAQVDLAFRELETLARTSRGIQELTISGMRNTSDASLNAALLTVQAQLLAHLDRLDQQLRLSLPSTDQRFAIGQAQLEVALRNLLLNASHAAGEGGVLRLDVDRLGRMLILRVEDSGPGFDDRAIARIGSRIPSAWGGQGIGLLIVQRVVDEVDGSLRVSRSPSLGGACVTLCLPLIP